MNGDSNDGVTTADVLIVGAGPVGLFLAAELALQGLKPVVLERDLSPLSPWKEPPLGIRGLFQHATEAFYRRGLLDDIRTTLAASPRFGSKMVGHFAGLVLHADAVNFEDWPWYVENPAFLSSPGSIAGIEAVLGERAEQLGVEILRGQTVTSLEQSDTKVTVNTADRTFTAPFLVGADGGRSAVRKLAGFQFPGTEPTFTGYIATCEVDGLDKLQPGFALTRNGMYIRPMFQAKQGPPPLYALDFDNGKGRELELTPERYTDILRRVTGEDVTVTKIGTWTTFSDRCRQVTNYRSGRVLLAGDAAHIHPPLGAQGMNTSLADAMNLGWKLASVVKGNAPDGLLDTYTTERHPVGEAVLQWNRAQVATLVPNETGRALQSLMRDLIKTKDGTNYFAQRIFGIDTRYDVGAAHDAHELVGKSVPDFEFEEGRRLGEMLRSGKFQLVEFEKGYSLAAIAEEAATSVDYTVGNAKETFGLKALLVRPDGVVAWVSTGPVDAQSCKEALSRWLRV